MSGTGRATRLIGAAVFLVLVATLLPAHPPPGAVHVPWWCVTCATSGTSDDLLNVALFAPLGIALALSGRTVQRAVLWGVLLSTAVELLQLVVPGRDTSLSDVLTNGLGTGLGALAVQTSDWWLAPGRVRGVLLAWLAASAAAVTILGTALLLRPSLPTDAIYYAQWTAELGQFLHYDGRVTSAAIDGLALPEGPIRETPRLREALLRGDTLRVAGVAGHRLPSLGPIFSVFDAREREIFLVGAERGDLVVRIRRRGRSLGLQPIDWRLPGALAAERPGSPLRLATWSGPRGRCAALGPRRSCAKELGPGSGWQLLLSAGPLAGWQRTAADLAWLFLLALPLGFWLRPEAASIAALGLVAGALVLAPRLGPVHSVLWGSWLAVGVGVLAGAALSRRVRMWRERPSRSVPPEY